MVEEKMSFRLDSIKRRIETPTVMGSCQIEIKLSDLIPLKEGLKHCANNNTRIFKSSFRLDSIKRRIETQERSAIIFRAILSDLIPLKEGLKL